MVNSVGIKTNKQTKTKQTQTTLAIPKLLMNLARFCQMRSDGKNIHKELCW